jgi:hypothetical protein
LERAVAPDELNPVAACGAGRVVHIEERYPIGELRVVGVASK